MRLFGLILSILITHSEFAFAQGLPPLEAEVAAEFEAVGRLGRNRFLNRQGCTATLVTSRVVVTAAHCANGRRLGGKTFFPGWRDGQAAAEAGIEFERRHPDYDPSNPRLPENDIAVILLDRPVVGVQPIPLGQVGPALLYGTEAALLGYHRGTPDRLSGRFDCAVGRFSGGLLRLGCPVINGNSGSPVLQRDVRGEWQVVAVVSSTFSGGAVAVELPEWVFEQIELLDPTN